MIGEIGAAAAVAAVFSIVCKDFRRQAEIRAANEAAGAALLIRKAESGQAPEPRRRCRACGTVCWRTVHVHEIRPRWPNWEECSATPGVYHYTRPPAGSCR